MRKLSIHEQVAKRDAEENKKPKKHGFHKKERHSVLGEEVSKETWMKHLSMFGTSRYSGKVIKADGTVVDVVNGKEI